MIMGSFVHSFAFIRQMEEMVAGIVVVFDVCVIFYFGEHSAPLSYKELYVR